MHTEDTQEKKEKDQKDQAESKGKVTFTISYDDTGAEKTITASNGWRIREVIEKGYAALGEAPRPGDRVEANGVAMEPYLDMHVKGFVEQGIAPERHFSIVSNTGGAVASPAAELA
jgi:hypothetical protein